MFRHRCGALLTHATGVLLALLLCAGTAAAQPSCTEDPCGGSGDETAPIVSIKPASGTYAQPSVPVEITFSDGHTLDDASRMVTLNGVNVTTSFQYGRTSGTLVRATARGTVALRPGKVDTLTASIQDLGGHADTVTVFYTHGVPSVRVTPDGGATSTTASGTARTYAFTVTNTGPASGTFTLQAACRDIDTGAVVSCSVGAQTTLLAGASNSVNVSYTAATAGSRIALQLRARQVNAQGAPLPGVEDGGWAEVDVHGTGGTPGAPAVTLAGQNASTAVTRGECLTVSAGAGAAYECGDLRLAHAAPGMMTMGKGRAPVLLYNHQYAHPLPIVHADVRLPAGTSSPQQVVATVTLTNGTTYTRTFTGSDWQPGATRRIGVQWDGLGTAWGLMPYTLQVTAVYAGGVQHSTTVQGEMLPTVRGGDSPFGTGWWLAGLDRMACYCQNGSSRLMMWSGDGGTRMYEPVVPGSWTTWIAQNPDGRPDTLTLGPTGYVRKLQGGGHIVYDGYGRHELTVSRLGDTTRFHYDGTTSYLTYIRVPSRDGISRGFRFTYSGWLTAITPEINGVAQPGISIGRSGERITSITDPDGLTTQFGYGDAAHPSRITSRTSRDSTLVTYGYDAVGKLGSVTLALNGTQSIVNQFTAAESRGVNPGSTTLSSVALSQAYTLMDGPRSDVVDHTRIWITNRGAPSRIRDALGGETVLVRGNATYPSLVTEVRGPNARGDSVVVKSTATYDGRGRVATSTVVNPLGNGQNLTTAYTYDDLWDAPATVTAPGVGVTSMAYDPQNGNLLWQQQGGSTRRVYYDYNATGTERGLLARVRYPDPVTGAAGGGGADSLAYDSLGNLRFTRSPLGNLTHHYRDLLGRDTLVITPVRPDSADTELELRGNGTRARTGYDVMGRVVWTEAIGRPVALPASDDGRVPARISPAETLRVETQYDAMGRPRRVHRQSIPDAAAMGVLSDSMTYDRAGRMLSRKKSGVGAESVAYDPAGNATSTTTPRGHTITMEYDALGRLVRRTVPSSSDAPGCPPLWSGCPRFPFYATGTGGGFAAPAENFYYRYDGLGNQVYAENLDARVVRSYYPGGALRTDSTYMRAYAGMDYATHAFGLEYRYDAVGRMRALQHPTHLTGIAQADSFAYSDTTGAMVHARSRQGHAYTVAYDLLGRPVRLGYPGGGAERTTYDPEGRRLTRLDSLATAAAYAVLAADTFAYDARGKVTYIDGKAGSQAAYFRNWYSGLGNLLGTDWGNVTNFAGVTETFVVDAMGNQAQTSRWADGAYDPAIFRSTYQPGRGRIGNISKVEPTNPPSASFRPDSTLRYYDNAGNVTWGIQHQYGNVGSGGGMGGTITPNGVGIAHQTITRNFYGADNVLRVVQVHDQTYPYTYNGSYAEYRYDPLGRRIMERTRRDTVCSTSAHGCESTLTRFVWAGDQLLWELRVPGGNDVTSGASGLDATSASGDMYGRVSYFHAGGIDKPLLITKEGAESVVPRDTWRGQFHAGTSPTTGLVRDCQQGGQTGCLLIAWPGWRTTATHAWGDTIAPDIDVWYGGLVDGMRDASGQMYMRNRYYDPATGQFTQTDPIGLAGGLNAYGFAAGDPVSYSDPYGLSPDTVKFTGDINAGVRVWNTMVLNAKLTLKVGTRSEQIGDAREFLGRLWEMWNSDEIYVIDIRNHAPETAAHELGGYEFRRGDGAYVAQVDTRPAGKFRASLETRLAHELGGAYGRSKGRSHNESSLEFENLYRDARGGCPRRQGHEYTSPLCR